ncbi:gamma carbonic anhydrase family protein [Solemya velum gill symbiont]|uniref:gamma carbonic anhydrase family protein n=1 Tax=Solemya velum gill symbiont TaxID=2340 RepID=UPI000998DD8A|nr:gamma carbonic anhydrase family protein [Solemya velum gill symbiont]OOY98534.1 gamma carbonic anhydrase family protein [Solemya velum gill symbiont]OOZ00854.1 gamma carbonic anhydrase family protein [Solemya velum gill symbiont]OOZ03035.1 gamma carbonic anhydrase family protein [Solemya velum gill symbiont]OOZ05284.1 gamma carbonic anhydrase family protein [Solemya velum gill symbiont]OOZ07520.1 gamma carbonic anhydrase family protein [Solemya velum gill symbiont]
MIEPFEGESPDIQADCWIHPSAVIIGDVTIGSQSNVWPLCVIRGDVNSISIGERTNIQDGSVLHVTSKREDNPGAALAIGDEVTVGHKVMLHACTIGNHCLIGMGAIIMDNTVVEDNVIVGAGSLVPEKKRLESKHLYMGSPVKKIRPLTEQELSWLKRSAAHYVKLAARHENPASS